MTPPAQTSATREDQDALPAYLLEMPVDALAASLQTGDGKSGRLRHAVSVTPVWDGTYQFSVARLFRGLPYAEVRGILRGQGRSSTVLEVQAQSNRFPVALLAVLARNLSGMLQILAFMAFAVLLRQPWQGAATQGEQIRQIIWFYLFGSGFLIFAAIVVPALVIAAGEQKRLIRFFRDRAQDEITAARRRKREEMTPRR